MPPPDEPPPFGELVVPLDGLPPEGDGVDGEFEVDWDAVDGLPPQFNSKKANKNAVNRTKDLNLYIVGTPRNYSRVEWINRVIYLNFRGIPVVWLGVRRAGLRAAKSGA